MSSMASVLRLSDSEDDEQSSVKDVNPVLPVAAAPVAVPTACRRRSSASPRMGSLVKKTKALWFRDLPGISTGLQLLSALQIPSATMALELCCGEGGLTKALNAAGICAVGLDVKIHESHDIMNSGTRQIILDAFRGGKIQYVHLGIPCNTHSPARYPKLRSKLCPRGLTGLADRDANILQYANDLTDNLIHLGRQALEQGAVISIENPRASTLWSYDLLLSLEADYDSDVHDLHMWMFGEPYLKPTRVQTFGRSGFLQLGGLNRQCLGEHEHVRLSGWRSFQGQQLVPTHMASAYPARLCEAWAADVRKHLCRG